MSRSLDPREVWAALERGEIRLLSTCAPGQSGERFGWSPGAAPVSLARHALNPEGDGVVYLCQHAMRSKLTQRNGAAEVEGGFVAWRDPGLPVEQIR